MKLYSLGRSCKAPCYLLKFKQATIMLDCALDMTPSLHFTPLRVVEKQENHSKSNKLALSRELQLDIEGFINESNLVDIAGNIFVDSEPEVLPPEVDLVDLSTVDVILISNSFFMFALPFITEHTSFSGTIYATEPTLQLGSELMHELVTFAERVPKLINGTTWKRPEIKRLLPSPLKDLPNTEAWCTLYSKHDIKSSISKIQKVGFSEKLDLFGVLQLTPVSSGFSVGSCNWMIQSEYEKITYLSCSSSFTTHPLPFEQNCLMGSDVLILSGLTESPTSNPDAMLGDFCTNLANTIKGGGNVLVPCYPSGVIYDLFECLQSFMDNAGLTFTPVYFISPVADSSLAYSNVYAEWLCQNKQSKVYLPEPPFPHAELVKNGKLKHFANLHDGLSSTFKTPCVVFTGHPSLRFGDVVHFVELWGKSSSNTIIFTEPGFPFLDALAPYQPLAMKSCYCPIDPRLNFAQVNKNLREMRPRYVVIPEEYTQPPPLLPHRTDLVVQPDSDSQVLSISYPQVSDIPVMRNFEKISLSNKLATTLCPQEVGAGTAVAMVNGTLENKNNKYTLQPVIRSGEGSSSNRCLCGSLVVDEMLQSLSKRGITDIQIERTPTGHTVHLNDDDAVITLEKESTHIITHGNDKLRTTIRDALLECLSQM